MSMGWRARWVSSQASMVGLTSRVIAVSGIFQFLRELYVSRIAAALVVPSASGCTVVTAHRFLTVAARSAGFYEPRASASGCTVVTAHRFLPVAAPGPRFFHPP